ncbi:DUF2897 family protein [uncultured Shewanella sp.]|uniref:DUF2897 family protein n=1 Tax=uncultured Shewanella sp. TaxID=173975 RepID=UPI0026103214|nr:DUF2897 family protein [uncultured Shewanella sp.]
MSDLEVGLLILLVIGVIASNLAVLKYSAKYKMTQFGKHHHGKKQSEKDAKDKSSDDATSNDKQNHDPSHHDDKTNKS